jgi:phosphate transport system permease protein
MTQVSAILTPERSPEPAAGAPMRRRKFLSADSVLLTLTRGAAAAILVMLVLLVSVLAYSSWPSVRTFGTSFVTGTQWRPNPLERPKLGPDGKVLIEDGEVVIETIEPAFGALPVIYGTAVSSALALAFAAPFGIGAALFIVRVAPRLRAAGTISFLVEFLAAIPSIAYGMWGLFVLVPFLQRHGEPAIRDVLGDVPGLSWLFTQTIGTGEGAVQRALPLTGRDMFAGGLILAIMILPIITAVSRDVLRAVPRTQIEGSLALGATWWQSCVAMLRYSRSGLFGAVMLGLSRAAGETMAVTMIIGNNNQISPSIFAPAQTMASLLANEFAEAGEGLHRAALLEVALILLVMSLMFNMAARWLVVGKDSRTAAAH